MPINLHSFVESELEYPALAWNSLAWYWAYSFLSLGPRYMEYMQSGEYEIDKAFLFNDHNEAMNHIYGYDRQITVKEKFERAVDFYEYCCVMCRQSSINPPYDNPPDLDTIVELFRNTEVRLSPPSAAIDTSRDSILEDNEEFQKLWTIGNEAQRQQLAKDLAVKRKAAIGYVLSEVKPRMALTLDQVDKDSGFLTTGKVKYAEGVTSELMDEIMPEETQLNKLGCVYKAANGLIVTEGITGRYFKAGHNIEKLMWNESRVAELSGIHHAILFSWKQLMEKVKNS